MNRRGFLKALTGVAAIPFVGRAAKAAAIPQVVTDPPPTPYPTLLIDYSKVSAKQCVALEDYRHGKISLDDLMLKMNIDYDREVEMLRAEQKLFQRLHNL